MIKANQEEVRAINLGQQTKKTLEINTKLAGVSKGAVQPSEMKV